MHFHISFRKYFTKKKISDDSLKRYKFLRLSSVKISILLLSFAEENEKINQKEAHRLKINRDTNDPNSTRSNDF